MAVGNLLERGIQVKDMQIDAVERQQPRGTDPRAIYEELTRNGAPYPRYPDLKILHNSGNTEFRLVGVLFESLHNEEGARKKYEKLRSTGFYDDEKKLWNYGSSHYSSDFEDYHTIYDQMLGILAESIVDKQTAKALYSDLKHTPLYDQSSNNWYENMKDFEVSRSDIFLQYFSIVGHELGGFIETIFANEEQPVFEATKESLPEVRRF